MKDIAELKNHVYDIVGALHTVHGELGPGINEYCYQEALAMELSGRGIPFEREKAVFLRYRQTRDPHLRWESVPKSANGHGRVSPCAKGKLF
jgi:hypothetical protein